ncbi:MAG: hypothetical protein BGO67_11075 [Alphaproteobacteria bacterium 41-28]|nr:MAG: hypothetical protein BGO67_11075 [Alphaproteobacteria bacterium 41-28]
MLSLKSLHTTRISKFGLLAEKLGREGVHRAIAEHKSAGNPIYFTNQDGQIIKELADGRQFIVEIFLDGTEEVGKRIL